MTGLLERKLNNYNIDKCKTIVIHVGGNDADQGVDIETFTESYSSLLIYSSQLLIATFLKQINAFKWHCLIYPSYLYKNEKTEKNNLFFRY